MYGIIWTVLSSDFCRFYLEGMPQALAERNLRQVWNWEPSASAARESAAAERIFVAIDLETTGLDAGSDSIIEIGAVRFQGGRELERFDQLVKPPKSIPPRITQITGIRNSDVTDKPTIEQVQAELLAFVGSDVAGVIAHSATFDIGFLKAAGIDFHRPVYDTLELSQMLLPGRASYSLGELVQTLGIDATPNHRALQDALATAELFRRLRQQAATLPPSIHELLLSHAEAAEGWGYTQFFADTLGAAAEHWTRCVEAESGIVRQEEAAEVLPPVGEGSGPVYSVPEEELLGYFADDGPLASLMGSGYERRSGQVAMAAQVLHAFNSGDYLLIEAGTGTGKSLGYLLPAGLFAVTNRCRVVVATNTLALQDQLVTKDIPQVQAMLAVRPPADPHAPAEADEAYDPPALQAAVLKGRQNYLCMRAAARVAHQPRALPGGADCAGQGAGLAGLDRRRRRERYRAQRAGRACGLEPHLLGRGHLHRGALRRPHSGLPPERRAGDARCGRRCPPQ